ncbi:terminase small subunit [Pseudomonas aeruginosa]|uniref:terminase small subunit n=1 Tax=Pseudomonas aeruginosa TaxID=287 RepID=UPI0021F18CBF|nr:terminase small subunit [Pseudomonas aeruginosa]EIU2568433.1 terminase small subunit [Pseudomonas aeruginosa]EKG7550733.1 terminase small subunit [Pseudomonas aeruginosa]ELC7740904.1 terminase small subunit [Pseudomonas aeruginosa]ELQ8268466.1 terminase small subunit [Pseudomonas aeruginosa]ELS0857448.1 terminase small subunit [Pseudomonas aeruginosa]
MALTPKQEAFCLAYLETGNASEAYRQSYSASRMSDKQVWEEASKLLKNPKVAQRVEELRAPVRAKAQLTLEGHLARLDELSRKAEEDGQFSAAITAETNRGKAAGLYTEKVDHTSSDGTMSPVTPQSVDASLVKALVDKLVD